MSRYKNIVAELIVRVPELADECQPTIIPWLDICQRGSKEPLSPENIQYLRQFQIDNPDQCLAEIYPSSPYLAFESSLRPFLIELLHDSSRHARLQEIMMWLEELLGDDDENVQTLVAIGICEALISNEADGFPALFPFLGAAMRQSCRDFLPYFRVSEEIRHLLAS